MKFRAFLAALCLTGATAVPTVAAPTYEDRDNIQEHIELLNTLDDMGVNVQINNPHICSHERGVAGFWMGSERLFVLCQEEVRNAKLPVYTGNIVLASDDDLDTIRHEAHHVIQDCMNGRLDGDLVTYLDEENSEEFLEFYPDWKEEHIATQYREDGASEHVVQLEIEAWAVADLVSAPMIQDVLVRECAGL